MMDDQDPISRNPAELLSELVAQRISDPRVLAAMAAVPRSRFVPESLQDHAWANMALPIGQGQTISQPFIVALMTQALTLQATDRVLEIGTGSGYQAAVLSHLCAEVVSLERHRQLALSARTVLSILGISNVRIIVGDGSVGAPGEAPFDGILVAAAAPRLPTHLLTQLRPDGGRLVIPIGDMQNQRLLVIERHGENHETVDLGPVRFVPLIGHAGWEAEPVTSSQC